MDHDKLREAIKHVRQAIPWQYGVVADAAEAHLATLPKTKMVEVWRVEYARYSSPDVCQYNSRATAETSADEMRKGSHMSCIRVTGPHQQEVPA